MKPTTIFLAFTLLFSPFLSLQAQSELQLRKAPDHPMRYYLSLPAGWSPGTRWPVLIVLEAAEKEFRKNAERFVDARKDRPFIIVAPFITTNGQQGLRDSTIYPYPPRLWDSIDRMTTCRFDQQGLEAIIRDVNAHYSGSGKVFLTGFEAGTHLLWAMVFRHPELLYAAAPVAGNYRGRCMEDGLFSSDPSRVQLPIRNFTGSDDRGFGKNGPVYSQYQQARDLAIAHGFRNISETEVAGKGHVPLPDQVLNYFYGLWEKKDGH